ncbi:hypothetical protein BT96DRAFT_949002 [Gymnopus androsaceus JB14]|uniref:Uncharacterized protein n=1 Tax=Gymnopus androsaceus JB14 TaxID=1447944 RepID=A0A6A4GLM8_9AGAR|nr:hypothetical protein BT96DRAFT_949002 [Gymnopus androsaceus JB14]
MYRLYNIPRPYIPLLVTENFKLEEIYGDQILPKVIRKNLNLQGTYREKIFPKTYSDSVTPEVFCKVCRTHNKTYSEILSHEKFCSDNVTHEYYCKLTGTILATHRIFVGMAYSLRFEVK